MKIRHLFAPMLLAACLGSAAHATVIKVNAAAFTPAAGLITFSEFSVGTVNPVYAPASYGGGATAPTVSFGGFFSGQSLGTAATCPAGAAVSGCVVGTPSGPLSLSASAPATRIATDGSNPTSPVLSGTPTFNGPIGVLFDKDMVGVGLDGGFFNAIGGTAITAFDRSGNLIGSVKNEALGIEFLGLVTSDGAAAIAGLLFSLVGAEPAGFAIDNLRFGEVGQVTVPPTSVPEPSVLLLLALALSGIALLRRRSPL